MKKRAGHSLILKLCGFSCRYLTEAGLKKLTENKNNVLDEQGITKLALDVSRIFILYGKENHKLNIFFVHFSRRIFVKLLVVL